jgi:NAD(P)H-nitrite reductase large subunit
VVVVGHGMVGARFVEEVRRRDPKGARIRLTVLGAEPRPAYNRVLLSTVLAGGLSAPAVELHPAGWAARLRVDLRTGVTATAIDRERRIVRTDAGSDVPYDELVLATGSRAWLPPIDGMADPYVVTFRDLADCERIIDLARPGARFAVLGGGLLGCEAARGLGRRRVAVSWLFEGVRLGLEGARAARSGQWWRACDWRGSAVVRGVWPAGRASRWGSSAGADRTALRASGGGELAAVGTPDRRVRCRGGGA